MFCHQAQPIAYVGQFGSARYAKISPYKCKDCMQKRNEYGSLIGRAKARGYDVTITFDEFMQVLYRKPCHYCGARIKTFGVDRKDPSLEYEISNVVPCCKPCNSKKSTTHYDVFISRGKMSAKEHKKFQDGNSLRDS